MAGLCTESQEKKGEGRVAFARGIHDRSVCAKACPGKLRGPEKPGQARIGRFDMRGDRTFGKSWKWARRQSLARGRSRTGVQGFVEYVPEKAPEPRAGVVVQNHSHSDCDEPEERPSADESSAAQMCLSTLLVLAICLAPLGPVVVQLSPLSPVSLCEPAGSTAAHAGRSLENAGGKLDDCGPPRTSVGGINDIKELTGIISRGPRWRQTKFESSFREHDRR